MKKFFSGKYVLPAVLLLFCTDLFWKLLHWNNYAGTLERLLILAALTVRFTLLWALILAYRRFRRNRTPSTGNGN